MLLSLDEFFPSAGSRNWNPGSLFSELISREQSLEIRLLEDGVEVNLVEPVSNLVLEAAPINELAQVKVFAGVFAPLALDFSAVTLPLGSIFSLSEDAKLSEVMLRAVYSHLLLDRVLEIRLIEAGSPRLALEYFYFLRWMFQGMFDHREREFEYFRHGLLQGGLTTSEPFFDQQLALIEGDRENLNRAAVKRRLHQMRQTLLEVA